MFQGSQRIEIPARKANYFISLFYFSLWFGVRYYLKDAVLEGGIPFNKAYGMTAFEYHGTDPRFNKVFNRGMSDHSTITMKKILETYKGFEGLKTVVDVGGGIGATLNMIISKYPHIKGINFDLPHVVSDAPNYPGMNCRPLSVHNRYYIF